MLILLTGSSISGTCSNSKWNKMLSDSEFHENFVDDILKEAVFEEEPT